MRGRIVGVYLAVAAFAFFGANVAVSWLRIDGDRLPGYATWTGVLELEHKLRLLREFEREGAVDALILSSSMGDHGISAETISGELSAHYGRTFRVFNFSIGGADLTTYGLLYRYARLVSKPRQVWVVAPLSVVPPKVPEGSLEEKLLAGPVARYGRIPGLLWLSHRVFELPLVRDAAALRDAAVHQAFPAKPPSNLDLYAVNAHGDMISWIYNVTQYPQTDDVRRDRRDEVLAFADPDKAERRYNAYLNSRTVAAVENLRDAAAADGASVVLAPFDNAASLAMRDAEFLAASQRFFEPLSRFLGANLRVDVREEFELAPYMVSDVSHLNTLGARAYSRLLAARLAGNPPRAQVRFAASAKVMNSLPDPTWTSFTALVPRAANEPTDALELRYLQNPSVGRLDPGLRVMVGLRLPDDTEVVVPAQVISRGIVLADTSRVTFQHQDQILVCQLLIGHKIMGWGAPVPLAAWRWRPHASTLQSTTSLVGDPV